MTGEANSYSVSASSLAQPAWARLTPDRTRPGVLMHLCGRYPRPGANTRAQNTPSDDTVTLVEARVLNGRVGGGITPLRTRIELA